MLGLFQKKEIAVISYSEMWDRFNYYGLQAVIILYLTQFFLLSSNISYSVYGTFIALSFGFTIIGGFISDKFLGFYYSTWLGGILITSSNIILSFTNLECTYLGLALMVIGIGLFKPNNVNLLGTVYSTNSIQREQAFSAFYVFVNIGCVLGPILYGTIAENYSYRYSFILSALGMLGALFYLNKYRFELNKQNKFSFSDSIKIFTLLSLCTLGAWFLLKNTNIFCYILLIISGIALPLLIQRFRKFTTSEKKSVTTIFFPLISCVIFFACLLQIYSSLLIYADKYIDRTVYTWKIPAAWFSSLEPIFIILVVPIMNKVWKKLKTININPTMKDKIIIGLLFAAISFYVFTFSTYFFLGNKILTFILILLANLVLAISELCIIPVTMSLTNLAAPDGYKGIMIGILYFSFTLSGYFSGVIAKLIMNQNHQHQGITSITHSFMFLATGLFIFFLLMLFLNKIFDESENIAILNNN